MHYKPNYLQSLPRDGLAGLVVFLVALPLCLGVALASGAPPISGIVAGIIGGVLVVWISGSHTSVSGPAAGLTAIVAAQIAILGSFEAFLVAVILAGVLQLGLAALRAGSLAAFFPSSVIKGLLAAIGIILILKQIPHLFGHDSDWLGDLSFHQIDGRNTISELWYTLSDIHLGATLIGALSIVIMVGWDKTPLARFKIPAPLVVVLIGIALSLLFGAIGGDWVVQPEHLVQVPVLDNPAALPDALYFPDFSALTNPSIIAASITIAVVASLETLLNVEAVDKLDKQKRVSPPNRELLAQGIGNVACGFAGGLPVTSVVVRSSVGINAGAETRIACFVHGLLLVLATLLLAQGINQIPLSCLAAILLVTGVKLASPELMKQMWDGGKNQFAPFIVTIIAIVFTDLLVGILIGLAVAAGFILRANLRRPLRQRSEVQAGGAVTRIELAQHVSFLNRAALREALYALEDHDHVVIDASNTVHIDPDIFELLAEFEREFAPVHDIEVSRVGFEDRYHLEDHIAYSEVNTAELQASATPDSILQRMKDGNVRYVAGELSQRDHLRQIGQAAERQYPLAIVLSDMDSRVHPGMIFDMGIGDMLSIRVAGNIATTEAVGSMEFGVTEKGAKVIMILGHTRCGAVRDTLDAIIEHVDSNPDTGNFASIRAAIAEAIPADDDTADRSGNNIAFADRIAANSVRLSRARVLGGSPLLRDKVERGEVILVGAMYDVDSGVVSYLDEAAEPPAGDSAPETAAAIDSDPTAADADD